MFERIGRNQNADRGNERRKQRFQDKETKTEMRYYRTEPLGYTRGAEHDQEKVIQRKAGRVDENGKLQLVETGDVLDDDTWEQLLVEQTNLADKGISLEDLIDEITELTEGDAVPTDLAKQIDYEDGTSMLLAVFQTKDQFLEYVVSKLKALAEQRQRAEEGKKETAMENIAGEEMNGTAMENIAGEEMNGTAMEKEGAEEKKFEEVIHTSFQGAHGRFPTIYSYGMDNGAENINPQYQGPHTLAHVSQDFLMDNAMVGYNFMEQVIDPDAVAQILTDFEVDFEREGRAKRYLKDYIDKYNELQYMVTNNTFMERPNALVRELMEMHPMTVYAWLTNIKQPYDGKRKKASQKSSAGKGESYGSTISLDKGWRTLIGTDEKKGRDRQRHMANYLALRLSMVIPEDQLENAVVALMQNGSITIPDNMLRSNQQQ